MFARPQTSTSSLPRPTVPTQLAGRRARVAGEKQKRENTKRLRLFQPAARPSPHASSCASRSTTPQMVRKSGGNSNSVHGTRPSLQRTGGSAVEAVVARGASAASKVFEDRIALGERFSQLQVDVDQRSSEVNALHEHTKILLRKLADCERQKLALQRMVEDQRAKHNEAAVCVICLSERATHVLVPCGHLALCGNCCSWSIHHCPVCRRTCEQKIHLFRP